MNKKRKEPSYKLLYKNPEILTTAQVAAIIQVTPDTVRKLCEKGELKARKFGRQWRVQRDDLKGFFANEKAE